MIEFYGSLTCHDSIRSRRFLDELQIPYRYIDVDHSAAATATATELNNGHLKTPTIRVNDKVLIEPTDDELGSALREANIYPPAPELKIV